MMRGFGTFAALAFAVLTTPAQAWSEPSHMTTGAIAFDDLSRSSPEILHSAEQILKAHPDYDQLAEHAGELTGAERSRVMFEWLARWADDIRDTDYSRPKWHYELRVVSGWTWLWPFRNGTASEGFDQNFATLSDPEAPAADRAIAMGWLMHIVGDMQQPLHAGHQMTSTFYFTDEAGSLSFVRKEEGGHPIVQHEYWDQSLDRPGAEGATSLAWAGPLQTLWPRAKLAEVELKGSPRENFDRWTDESMELARIYYRGTALAATAVEEDAPVVTPFELHFMEALAKRRVATAGYRIADTIRMALGESTKSR